MPHFIIQTTCFKIKTTSIAATKYTLIFSVSFQQHNNNGNDCDNDYGDADNESVRCIHTLLNAKEGFSMQYNGIEEAPKSILKH